MGKNRGSNSPVNVSLNGGYDFSKTNNKRIEMIMKKVERENSNK